MTKCPSTLLVVALMAILTFGGCKSPIGDNPTTPAATTPPTASTPTATATTPDPTATDPSTTPSAPEKAPTFTKADGSIVIGRTLTYSVRHANSRWEVVKTAPCEEGTDSYVEFWSENQDSASQAMKLVANWQARDLSAIDLTSDATIAEFELSTKQFCYVDDASGAIWAAHKCKTGEQHHDKWLYLSAAPGQVTKIFAIIKAELVMEHEELVARRKANLQRLQTAGEIPGNPS